MQKEIHGNTLKILCCQIYTRLLNNIFDLIMGANYFIVDENNEKLSENSRFLALTKTHLI